MLIFFLIETFLAQLSNTHIHTPAANHNTLSAACYKARRFILLWEGWVFETDLCHFVKCVCSMHLSRQIWIDFWIYTLYRSGRLYRGYLRRAYACLSLFTTAKSTRTLLSQTGLICHSGDLFSGEKMGTKVLKGSVTVRASWGKGNPFTHNHSCQSFFKSQTCAQHALARVQPGLTKLTKRSVLQQLQRFYKRGFTAMP